MVTMFKPKNLVSSQSTPILRKGEGSLSMDDGGSNHGVGNVADIMYLRGGGGRASRRVQPPIMYPPSNRAWRRMQLEDEQ